MLYHDQSTNPRDLLRNRKMDVYDPTNDKELIQNDLFCCDTTFGSAFAVNEHYRQHHLELPRSDPASWSHVVIRDQAKHAELGLLLPYVLFSRAQPKTSTWTVRLSPRINGTSQERGLKRILSKKCNPLAQLEIAQLMGNYKELQVNSRKTEQLLRTSNRSVEQLKEELLAQEQLVKRLTLAQVQRYMITDAEKTREELLFELNQRAKQKEQDDRRIRKLQERIDAQNLILIKMEFQDGKAKRCDREHKELAKKLQATEDALDLANKERAVLKRKLTILEQRVS